MADYVKFLLKLQANCQKFPENVLVDDIEIYEGRSSDDLSNFKMIR